MGLNDSDQFFSNLCEEEAEKICNTFNDTDHPYNTKETVVDFFEQNVEKNPDNVALICGGKRMTYKELSLRVNLLTALLRSKGLKDEEVVPIVTHRSFEMIIGIFAILKAGGAYLPLSPETPDARIKLILEDCGAKILLVQGLWFDKMKEKDSVLINLGEPVRMEPEEKSFARPGGLAYVIYTSGSTGLPKGVMIEHHSLVNRLAWMQKRYVLDSHDVLIQKTPYSFDVSVWEIFWWSLCGASLSLLASGMERFPQAIIERVFEDRVTVIHFVPSMLSAFLNYVINDEEYIRKLKSLKYLFTSGEALLPDHIMKFNQSLYALNATRLINLYGPTEATIDVTCFECPPGEELEKVPIGKPIHNTRMYIVKDNRLQPVGEEGELCIAGVGLARGYLGRPELTREKFVPHPFLPGERMYRTGDIACWMEDGNIEYRGRMDHQVKIRGLRIELGEIESALLKHPSVQECVVIVNRSSDTIVNLEAFLVGSPEVSPRDLKKFLGKTLPDYMVPGRFHYLSSLPLTVSGKINRKQLAVLCMDQCRENEVMI